MSRMWKEISDSAQVCQIVAVRQSWEIKNEIMKTSLLADIGFTVLGIICAIFAFVATIQLVRMHL